MLVGELACYDETAQGDRVNPDGAVLLGDPKARAGGLLLTRMADGGALDGATL